MKILVLYGTTDGQTRKICEYIAERLRSKGDVVTLVDAVASHESVDLHDYQGAILAASIHVGQYQKPVVQFARANHVRLNQIPSAFVSVSLSIVNSDSEEQVSLATCTQNFKDYTGWTRAEVHHVAGAIRFSEYDFFKRWGMKLLAWEKNLKLEPGNNLELTDWEALAAMADDLHVRFTAECARN